MFDVGGGEFLLIVIAILVLFGPKKIPEVAQMIGKGMRKVRQAQAQFQTQINELQNEMKTAAEFDPQKVNTNWTVKNPDEPPTIIDNNIPEHNELMGNSNETSQPSNRDVHPPSNISIFNSDNSAEH